MVITLLTDFGLEDNFVGVMKGVILGINSRVKIIDITHNISPQDVIGAAFLLCNSYKFFPKGSIHLAVVDPGVGSKRKAIIVETEDYIFVGPDNGVLSPALQDSNRVRKIIQIANHEFFLKPVSNTFHGRDIFAPITGHLSRGIPVERFGKVLNKYVELSFPSVRVTRDILTGEIVYIDHFGNLITNIGKDKFYNFIAKREFKIQFKRKIIDKIDKSYAHVPKGRVLASFGSFNNLEISIAGGNAKEYFKVREGERITVSRF